MIIAVKAKIIKQVKIPKIVAKNDDLISAILLFLCLIIDNNLIDKTGKTQGMIFKIAPPIKAIKIIKKMIYENYF